MRRLSRDGHYVSGKPEAKRRLIPWRARRTHRVTHNCARARRDTGTDKRPGAASGLSQCLTILFIWRDEREANLLRRGRAAECRARMQIRIASRRVASRRVGASEKRDISDSTYSITSGNSDSAVVCHYASTRGVRFESIEIDHLGLGGPRFFPPFLEGPFP